MKAEIYYLEDQQGLVDGIAEILRANLHPDLEVETNRIAFSDERQVLNIARRYVKLLQASIRPETGLQVGIYELDHLGYRFYIYVYYEFVYSSLKPLSLRDFFPAIAVRNRMALVPVGLGNKLDWTSRVPGSVLKSPEIGGAAEVSFDDRSRVEEALKAVAQSTRADLLREIRAYADYRKPGEISLPTLAQDM